MNDPTVEYLLEEKAKDELEMARLNDYIDEYKATIVGLKQLIKDHNDDMDQRCAWYDGTGRCEAYTTRGKTCPDCPREDRIKIDETI